MSISGLSVGEHHFVCAVGGHCQAGMRFTVTVTPTNEEHTDSEQVSTHQLDNFTTVTVVFAIVCRILSPTLSHGIFENMKTLLLLKEKVSSLVGKVSTLFTK